MEPAASGRFLAYFSHENSEISVSLENELGRVLFGCNLVTGGPRNFSTRLWKIMWKTV